MVWFLVQKFGIEVIWTASSTSYQVYSVHVEVNLLFTKPFTQSNVSFVTKNAFVPSLLARVGAFSFLNSC